MKSELALHICLLSHDAYYLNGDQMPAEVRQAQNWDHPDSLDNGLFLEHITQLLSCQAVNQPVYDFSLHLHSRSSTLVNVEPRPILLLEGVLIFAIPEIRDRIDLRLFVDTPSEERIVRRMLRDIAERGRTVDSVAVQFRSTVRPMHDQFVEPSRSHAHVVIPWDWNGNHQPAVDMLLARIGQVIGVRK